MSTIKSLQFRLISADEIRRRSVVSITVPTQYEPNGRPKDHSLSDLRMGSTDRQYRCTTCGQGGECPGHFGHIELHAPVYCFYFINTLLRVLQCVCFYCGQTLLSKGELDAIHRAHHFSGPNLDILRDVAMRSKRVTVCPEYEDNDNEGQEGGQEPSSSAFQLRPCCRPQPKLRCKNYMIYAEYAGGTVLPVFPCYAQRILCSLTPAQVRNFGLPAEMRPEWMIMMVLLVPSPILHPPRIMDSGKRSEDDITRRLHDILRANIELGKQLRVTDENPSLVHRHCCVEPRAINYELLMGMVDRDVTVLVDSDDALEQSTVDDALLSDSFAVLDELCNIQSPLFNSYTELRHCRDLHVHERRLEHTRNVIVSTTAKDLQVSRETMLAQLQTQCSMFGEIHGERASRAAHTCMEPLRSNESGMVRLNYRDRDKILEAYVRLHDNIIAYFLGDACVKSTLKRSHRQQKLPYIKKQLESKRGRMRQTVMGKRCDFSSRSVITPDPSLRVDELGVPLVNAMKLSYPEVVTVHNYERLWNAVMRGPYEYPGANAICVLQPNGEYEMCDLRVYHKPRGMRVMSRGTASGTTPDPLPHKLKLGDKVERHLVNGDDVIFNRQPSLHRGSMMGHRVVTLPGLTYRLNLAVTAPYNADFDGDEMNMHVPQSEEARAETRLLMGVPNQIVSPQSNRPMIGLVQNELLGAYLLSRADIFLSRAEMMQLAFAADSTACIALPPAAIYCRGTRYYTGKQALQCALPDGFFYETNVHWNEWGKDADGFDLLPPLSDMMHEDVPMPTIIRDGEILASLWNKRCVGSSAGSIIHVLVNDYGSNEACTFINRTQRVANAWMQKHGFSIGMDDIVNDNAEECASIARVVSDVQSVDDGDDEECVSKHVASVSNRVGHIVRSSYRGVRGNNDAFIKMISGQSKGSILNKIHVSGCIGQQKVMGARLHDYMDGRVLPHFCKYDTSPQAHGFVTHSYAQGVSPTEFYCMAMGGREGLIDTACKTSETGYLQRKFGKAMEDHCVYYDGSTRDTQRNIIQFQYGEDGFDGTYLEVQSVAPLFFTDEAFDKHVQWEFVTQDELMLLHMDRAEYQETLSKHTVTSVDRDKRALPVNIGRLWKRVEDRRRTARDIGDTSIVHPLQVLYDVSALCSKHTVPLIRWWIRLQLCTKQVCAVWRLTTTEWEWMVLHVTRSLERAHCPGGEMVGPLASQSIGEPSTQMTLNTFHYAGVGNANVTLGIPRLKEIINVAKSMDTPCMTMRPLADTLYGALASARQCVALHAIELFDTPEIMVRARSIQRHRALWRRWLRTRSNPTDVIGSHVLVLPLVVERTITAMLTLQQVFNYVQCTFIEWIMTLEDNVELCVNAKKDMQLVYTYSDVCDAEWVILLTVSNICLEEVFGTNVDGGKLWNAFGTYLMDASRIFCGIDGVTVATVRADTNKQWMVDTNESNLHHALQQGHMFDTLSIMSNSICDVYERLGIEAARTVMLEELIHVMSPGYIDYRHLSLLVDTICHYGFLMSVTRFGFKQSEESTLKKSSFEQILDTLQQASTCQLREKVVGVADNTIFGQSANIGTHHFDIVERQVSALPPYNPYEPYNRDIHMYA